MSDTIANALRRLRRWLVKERDKADWSWTQELDERYDGEAEAYRSVIAKVDEMIDADIARRRKR